jgi:predicted dehydrogenase
MHEVLKAPGFELAGWVEPDAERRVAVSRELRVRPDRGFSSLTAALDTALDCDAVLVVTPPADHVVTCREALEAGRAVLVEKPFTLSLADAVALVHLADAQRRPLLVAQNYRYMRAFRTLRRVIADGRLGQLAHIQCEYHRVPHEMPEWLRRSRHSVLWGAAVHHFDALRHVTGEEVVGVIADPFSAPGTDLPVGGSLRAWLRFESGLRATYFATYESSGHEFFERGQEFYVRVVGDRGTLHVLHRWLVWCERGRWPRLIRRGRRAVSEERVLLDQLAEAIRTGSEPDCSGRDNLATMAILESYLRSSAEHVWVDPRTLLGTLSYA